MSKSSMIGAGIDTGKRKLDVALAGAGERLTIDNSADGHVALVAWLRRHRVTRVGIEASGGYEAAVVAHLRRHGLVVIVFQPAQVRAYGVCHRKLAKNDALDASLIAECTVATKIVRAPPDPRLAPFAEQLTFVEQLTAEIAQAKTKRESCRNTRLRQLWSEEIARRKALVRSERKALEAAIRAEGDLAQRLDLIASVAGVGLPTALAILVRLPEIGQLTRAEVAALAGLAPYDDDSGAHAGLRHIAGGRARLRHAVYAAALPAAFKWNPQLGALYRRLIAKGKPHKCALVACARKLIIYVNTVVERQTPWRSEPSFAEQSFAST